MAIYSEPISKLISELAKLPGIGRKTAQRLAYHILSMDTQSAYALANAITAAKDQVKACSVCNNITDQDPCAICDNPKRDRSVICVVQDAKDVVAIERTKEFKGLYHVLGGAISPMEGVGPEDLHIQSFMRRLTTQVQEVILATNLTIEGETTAMYLARLIKPFHIKTTRIARGIPAGADLEYTDEATLAGALAGRKVVE